MITLEQATKNVAKYARKASKQNWTKGAQWYPEVNSFCRVLANYEHLPLENVAGCVAALSPQCSWPENLRATLALVKTRTTGPSLTLPRNQSKAFSIVHEGIKPEDVLGGLKVKAFYANILKPQHSKAVTIDTHAARAAFGIPDLTTKHLSWIFRPKGNRLLQQAYKNVAKRYKVLPSTLQATVWLRVKDTLKKLPDSTQQTLYIK